MAAVPRAGLLTLSRLLALAALLLALPAGGSAQETVTDPAIQDLVSRNTNLGLDCNDIGYSVPTLDQFPRNPAPRWAADHSTCLPGFRFVLSCLGQDIGDVRLIGCTLGVPEGQVGATITCDNASLIGPGILTAPDPALSDALAAGSPELFSCSAGPQLTSGANVALAFLIPAPPQPAHLAMTLSLGEAGVVSFIIPAFQIASGQPALAP